MDQYPPQGPYGHQAPPYPPQGYGPPPPYQPPPRKSWPRRHKVLTALLAVAALIIISAVSSALSKSGGTNSSLTASGNVQASTPQWACGQLARWENSSGTHNLARSRTGATIEQETTGTALGSDFRGWMDAIKAQSGTRASAGRVSADCKAVGVPYVLNGGQAPAAAAAPAPKPAPARHTVTYVVSGSPADVTYGPSGTNDSGTVPMSITRTLRSPAYYAITAQLQGSGSVSCEIRVNGKVISRAHATGGYNIASCEISPDPLTGVWQDTNS
jgi:hypothetical protein